MQLQLLVLIVTLESDIMLFLIPSGQQKKVFKLIVILFFLAFFQAVIIRAGLLLGKEQFAMPFYITVDVIVIGTSNAMHKESTIVTLEPTNKKITKLSMRIMLLLCFLFTPYLIIYTAREVISNQFLIHYCLFL